MNTHLNIPLFWKFTIAITGTVLLFGIINLYFINYAVYDLFESELTRYGKITATSIAERSIDPIAYGDLATLDRIVTDQKRIDPTIAYIFILSKNNKVLAHTFEQSVPPDLLSVYPNFSSDTLSSAKIQRKEQPSSILIRDMAFPIMKGNLGVVRIGLYEENYLKSMNKTTRVFWVMVFIFLVFGVLGAFVFSYVITSPIKGISEIAKKMELGTLDDREEDYDYSLNRSELVRWKNILNAQDEIDTLIYSFGEMVSRLKTTYNELQKTQRSLIHSEKMASLGTLSSGIAHEINNPLAGIQSCIRRLKESPENLTQNISYLEMMADAVNRIEMVVGGLLDFSRKPELRFEKVNLVEIIESVLLLTAYQFEKSRITITKQYNPNPRYIYASRNHIEQVILNLVLNSIDAIQEKMMNNPDYNGNMVFNLKERKKEYEFELSDNGIGVPEQNLSDIFDPFFTLKKIKQGTGLGLAVSFGIVEQHNGRFITHLNKEGGLTISVLLPKFDKNK